MHNSLKIGVLALCTISLAVSPKVVMATESAPRQLQHVLLLRPDNGNDFWNTFQKSAEAACKSLGCIVDTKIANQDHTKMVQDLKDSIASAQKPDLVLYIAYKRVAGELLQIMENSKIANIMVNAGPEESEIAEIGGPRQKFKYWIGTLLPNDVSAGKLVAQALYEKAKALNLQNNGKIEMIAIEGTQIDGASVERGKGLREFMAQHPDIELKQVVQSRWNNERTYSLTMQLLNRYPTTSVIWTVADDLALQVVRAAKDSGRTPGKDILTAGVDWSENGLKAVESGDLVASAGGHYMEGAWAVIMGYDYFNGADFANRNGTALGSEMSLITKDNIIKYKENFTVSHLDNIDYKSYSKFYNKNVSDYKFTKTPLFQ